MKHTAKALDQLVVPFRIDVKAASEGQNARTFEGLLSVWDLDLGMDKIKKGAFARTLKAWKNSGEALPLLNSHSHWDVFSSLGQLLEAKETDKGLWTKWEVIDGPDGDALLLRLRPSKINNRAVVGKMSIGYEAVKFSYEQIEGGQSWDRIRILEEVNLKEGSVVLFPMAPGASIDASTVKSVLNLARNTDPATLSDEVKQDLRRLSGRIGRLLKKTAPETPAEPSTPPNPETPETPAETPPTTPPVTPPSEPETEEPPPEEVPKSENTPDVYQYSEALQQRLTRTLLKNRVSAITK